MKTPIQPAGEPAGLIRKYYPSLGEHLPSPTLPDLAAEWYSDLSRLGKKGLGYYVTDRHERASNKAEFTDCVAMLLAEVEQHAHLPGYGYRRDYLINYPTPEREAEVEASGRATLRAVREWHTLAILSPVEQFLDRARKIELWQNDRHQLTTREGGHEEWNEEYAVLLLALQRAVPTAKKRLLRAAYTELKRLLPTLKAGRPLKWHRLYDEGQPFFSSTLTATYAYSEFVPLRPTQSTTDQISELFFQYLHVHLCEKEWHVWQALILLAGALGEAAPPTPETFQEKQTEPAPAPQPLDTPAPSSPRPEQTPYFHLSPEGIERRFKLRKEAHNAGRRQAMCNQLRKGLTDGQRKEFEAEKSQHDSNVNTYTEWLELQLFYTNEGRSDEQVGQLNQAINEEAADISQMLPYSDSYGPNFIKQLKAEPLLKVNEFLQFVREPWYAGLAGFYWLDKADDVAYFRDLITENLTQHPNDDSPTMRRAIEWLTAEIERLQAPGATAFRKSMFREGSVETPLDTPAPSSPRPEQIEKPAPKVPRRAAVSDWTGLLTQPENFGFPQLMAAFQEVRLLGADGLPTEWGRTCKGEWAGAIDALTAHKPALLTVNARAAARCLARWGIVLAENTLINNTSAGADNVRKTMKEHLKTI